MIAKLILGSVGIFKVHLVLLFKMPCQREMILLRF